MRYLSRFATVIAMALAMQVAAATAVFAAGSNAQNVKIVGLAVDSDGTAFIRSRPMNQVVRPGCFAFGDTWDFVFKVDNPTGQAMLATALTARVSDLTVRIVGSGQCNVFPGIETVYVIDISTY